MRILVIGGTGTIGAAVVHAFEELGDSVVPVSRSSTPSVDITDPASLNALFASVGEVDAVITALGAAPSAHLTEATPDDFAVGFASKLGGQIGAVLAGLPYISDGGSFTLTTGILAQHGIPGSNVAATVNSGLEGFVNRAALDLPRGVRINAVSPNIVLEPGEVSAPFRGFGSVTRAETAQAYVRSVTGIETGQVFRVW